MQLKSLNKIFALKMNKNKTRKWTSADSLLWTQTSIIIIQANISFVRSFHHDYQEGIWVWINLAYAFQVWGCRPSSFVCRFNMNRTQYRLLKDLAYPRLRSLHHNSTRPRRGLRLHMSRSSLISCSVCWFGCRWGLLDWQARDSMLPSYRDSQK